MAVEESNVIEFDLDPDVYTLKRSNNAVGLFLGPEEQEVKGFNVSGAKISEAGVLEIQGRPLGQVDPEACTLKFGGEITTPSLENIQEAVAAWYPPGNVKHIHNMKEFDAINTTGILCAKFSAEWCGPCKMIAPHIEALSRKYSNVTFVHMDEAEAKKLFTRESIAAYPTFKFFKDGKVSDTVVQGGDLATIEATIASLGGQAAEAEAGGPEKPDGEIKFCTKRKHIKLEKAGAEVKFSVDGTVKKCPAVKLDPETRKISCGVDSAAGDTKIWKDGGYDLNDLATKFKEWFPNNVKHIHGNTVDEFDKIIKTGVTCAKFSAEWCGPCKRIEGDYIMMSNKNPDVHFLHIDVDSEKKLSAREGIEAMPTFVIFKDGVNKGKIRGANLPAVISKLKEIGVDYKS